MRTTEDIKEKYGEICDSWVSKIFIFDDQINLTITCANKFNNFKYETILLIFQQVELYVVDERHFMDNYAIKNALIEKENELLTIDLDPIDYFDHLKENNKSTFKIKCKGITYEFIEEYSPH